MKNVSKKVKVLIVVGALVAMTMAMVAVAFAEPVDPPVGFSTPMNLLASIVDPPVGSPIRG